MGRARTSPTRCATGSTAAASATPPRSSSATTCTASAGSRWSTTPSSSSSTSRRRYLRENGEGSGKEDPQLLRTTCAGHLQSPRPAEQLVVGRAQSPEQPRGAVLGLLAFPVRAEAGLHQGHGLPQGGQGEEGRKDALFVEDLSSYLHPSFRFTSAAAPVSE